MRARPRPTGGVVSDENINEFQSLDHETEGKWEE